MGIRNVRSALFIACFFGFIQPSLALPLVRGRQDVQRHGARDKLDRLSKPLLRQLLRLSEEEQGSARV